MSRRSARENVFKLAYEFLETGERNDFTKELLCSGQDEGDCEYVTSVYDALVENYEFLKKTVSGYSRDFAYDRIYKTDLAAILVATCELLYRDDVPDKVAVNEALELTHAYSTEKSSSFVNGILASVIRDKEALKNAGENN